MDERTIIDGLKIICRCRGIKKRELLKHIASGLTSVAELQRATGAGTGDCQGKHCTERIEVILSANGQ